MTEIVTFQEALEVTSGESRRHLLLGNGFSRACRDDIFAYNALFEQAFFDDLSPTARHAFDALDTTDFEVVMRALRQAASLSEVYIKTEPDVAKQMRADADELRELLTTTIARNHPDRPGDIEDSRYAACKAFLNHFNNVYTVNYDLLLYWTQMQREIPPDIRLDDGFRQPDDGPNTYVSWEIENTNKQNVFYLHGALHIFDAGHEIQKYIWSNTGVALVDQIRDALAQNRFPLFVAEGSSNEKKERIEHSIYLGRGLRSIAHIGGALFIYGHSLAENDEHILKLINKGKSKFIAVGIYGDLRSDDNQRILRRALAFNSNRKERNKAEIFFFDAESAQVWG